MNDLVVLSGPPGSGKSTVAELVADRFEPSVLVTGDAFFGFVRRGYADPWRPESAAQNDAVVAASAAAAGRLTRWGTVVYDGVLGPWFVTAFLRDAGVSAMSYVVLLPPVEVCLARVAGREGHGFDDPAATRHMHAEFVRAEPADRHTLRDADLAPDETAAAVAALVRSGRAVVRAG